jgi:hypothetical protein
MSVKNATESSNSYLNAGTYKAHEKDYAEIKQKAEQIFQGYLVESADYSAATQERMGNVLGEKKRIVLAELDTLKNNCAPYNVVMDKASKFYLELETTACDILASSEMFKGRQWKTSQEISDIAQAVNLKHRPLEISELEKCKFMEKTKSSAVFNSIVGNFQCLNRKLREFPEKGNWVLENREVYLIIP